MIQHSPLFIANWKMKLSVEQELAYVRNNYEALRTLGSDAAKSVALCPSFLSLYPLSDLLESTGIALGAQACSAYGYGAYTGTVAAASLAQLNCHYVLAGHSERRMFCHEDNEAVARQVVQIVQAGMTPVVCVGEDQESAQRGATAEVLERQLLPVFDRITTECGPQVPLIIAYEPIWAIGTGVVPTADQIHTVVQFIKGLCGKLLPASQTRILYGGSVTSADSSILAQIEGLNGFLIGGASLDFQHLKKIVESWPL